MSGGATKAGAFKVGLTGGLASGKSTVARAFAEAGFSVVDADQVVRDLYRAGEPGATAVEHLFGRAALDDHGAVDPAKLSPIVFQSVAKRRSLEQAIHPLVRERFASIAAQATGVVVLEATLLVEAGYAPDFDFLISVEADSEIRRRRAIERGLSPADADTRLTVQGRGRVRRLAVHRMIRNDGGFAELERAIGALVDEIRARVAGQPFALEPFVLVTGNSGKLAEARRLAGRALVAEQLALPEIQSLELEDVLAAKADAAFARLGRAVVVEETGLYLAGLNGFPGPLVRWMLEAIGPDGLVKQAEATGDNAATARCALYYRSATCSVLAAGEAHGRLVLPPRGTFGFGWDAVLEDQGLGRTYGEMPDDQKDQIGHRGKAWRELLGKLRLE